MPILFQWATIVQRGNLFLLWTTLFFQLLTVNVVEYWQIFPGRHFKKTKTLAFWPILFWFLFFYSHFYSTKRGDYFLLINATATYAKGINGLHYERTRSNSVAGSFDVILTRRRSRSSSLAIPNSIFAQ